MKFINAAKKYGPGVAGFSLLSAFGSALAQSADVSAAAVTALGSTETDVTTVAVVVATIVALIAAATLIFGMMKKG